MSYIIDDFFGPSPRLVRPWELPDRNPLPRLDLFPRCRRLARLVARLLEVGK